MLATTRSLTRKAMANAGSIAVGSQSSICCNSPSVIASCRVTVPSATTTRATYHPSTTFSRGFSTVPTDDGEDTKEEKGTSDTTPTPDKTTEDYASTSLPPPPPSATSKTVENELKKNLKPSEIVESLNRHIVGQHDAKRAVAIAMRNRWRRRQLSDELRKEVTPRNVLLVGPTGCGKTEVARRMAMLNDAPFIKVEATKFTEVGYHGRDVDQIIRDLMDVAMQLAKKQHTETFKEQAELMAEERILDILSGPSSDAAARGRDSFREMLRQGLLDEQEIEIDVPNNKPNQADVDQNNPQIVAISDMMQRFAGGGKKPPTERKKLPITEAKGVILEIELERLLETVDLKKSAVSAVEESGIVFIDEIDKICSPREGFSSRSADASAEGVQRDLLPLIEGTTINTKHGNVNTDYILFIASGAFHAVKVSDLLPELQGRLPIRVELAGLTEDDLYKILTEPVANLIRQQVELIGAEGVDLVFEDEAIREIARMAALLNKTVENIGARRLHTVLERIMENISFDAAELDEGAKVIVDKATVQDRLKDVTMKADVSRYIL
ncbi:ATP-dependent protease ATP-binding subunit HslU [Nitzschia inconspicua]|uniref:ATP-dependent protease ATP-binding subunit HslU n=1 Tax=Nitzschia inconspicua TaxID=303405 RepID=A0A9K3Q8N0_9STRA|nr:ATP-dependent protease ATP-binding subunit HslU [Nitzschia inconspicua]